MKLPGKKALSLGAGVLVLGGAGFATIKYSDPSHYAELAALRLGIGEHVAAFIPYWGEEKGSPQPAPEHQHAGSARQPAHEVEKSSADEGSGHHNENRQAEVLAGPRGGGPAAGHETMSGSEEGGEHVAPEISYTAPLARESRLIAEVRALQMIQQRLAQGDATAVSEQQKILLEIGHDIAAIDPEKASLQEIYASVTYLLSGGRPDAVERFLRRRDLPKAVRKLLKGAIAYVRSDAIAASDELHDLDHLQFGASVAGHLALVQSRAIEDLPPERRQALLEFTSNTMLGTLLEEAALRRLMDIAAANNDTKVFLRSASRYGRRFARSLYNADYRGALLQGIVKLQESKHGPSAAQLDLLLFELRPERRNDILDSLAEAGLRNGLSDLCQYAASRRRRLAPEGSVPWTRASLYDASCAIAERGADALQRLKSLDVAMLAPEDRQLRTSALLLAEHAMLADTAGEPLIYPNLDAEVLTKEQSAFRDKVHSELSSIGKTIEESRK
jgi:hypothetical protein